MCFIFFQAPTQIQKLIFIESHTYPQDNNESWKACIFSEMEVLAGKPSCSDFCPLLLKNQFVAFVRYHSSSIDL